MRFFSESNTNDKGTLYNLKVLLNRSIPKEPKQNMKACEDFLLIVLYALCKNAAEIVMKDNPHLTDITGIAAIIINQFVSIGETFKSNKSDELHLYTTELFTLALVWHCYHDAIKEGDGDRVIDIWKFLLIIFKKAGRKNYSKEALQLLVNYHFLFSDRLAEQLKWSRFINTTGLPGANKPCDLHMEHLNRQLKGSLRNLHSNIGGRQITRAGKALGVVHDIETRFRSGVKAVKNSARHQRPSFEKDLELILDVLKETNPFTELPQRKLSKMKFRNCILHSTTEEQEKTIEWMVNKVAPMIF